MDEFFKMGNNKFKFANAYVKKIEQYSHVPAWIDGISNWIEDVK